MSATGPESEELAVLIEREKGVGVVRLRGSAGMSDADKLREQLVELAGAGSPRIIVDASELAFINSAGLGAFIAAHRRCREQGGMLCIVNPREQVAQLLRVTHLDRLMAVCADVESAREVLGGRPK